MATIKKSSTTRTSAKSTSTKRTTKTSSTAGSVAIDHVFENGVKVSGTLEQLETIAKAMGLKLVGIKTEYTRGFYSSESKGLIKISSMNEYHIRRALLKRSKDYFTEIFDKDDTNREFLKKFTSLTEDPIIIDLYTELSSR
jgi:hypothetical protein